MRTGSREDVTRQMEVIQNLLLDNPVTAEDWAKILTNPNTLLFKLMMSIIQENMNNKAYVENLLAIWIDTISKQTTEEKNAIIQEFVDAALEKQTQLNNSMQQQPPAVTNSIDIDEIKKNDLDELKELENKIKKTIEEQTHHVALLQKDIVELKATRDQHNEQLQKYQTKQNQELVQQLQAQQVQVLGINGKPIDPEVVNKIMLTPQTSFGTKLAHNPGLAQQLVALYKEGQDPSKTIARSEMVIDQMQKYFKLIGAEPTAKQMLEFIRLNDKQNQLGKIMANVAEKRIDLNAAEIGKILQLIEQIQGKQQELNIKSDDMMNMIRMLKTMQTAIAQVEPDYKPASKPAP